MLDNSFFTDAFNKNIIAVTLDSNRNFIDLTSAACKTFGYEKNELISKNLSTVLASESSLKDLYLDTNTQLNLEIKFRKKSGEVVDSDVTISRDLEKDEYYLLLKSNLEQASKNALEFEMALNESENRKNFLHTLLNEQKSIVLVIHMGMIIDANRAFLKFFDIPSLEYYLDNHGECIADNFEYKENKEYLQKSIYGQDWLEYVLETPNEQHKVLIKNIVLDVHVVKIEQDGDELLIVTLNDITAQEKAQNYIEESIEYASLIQHSLVPDNEIFRKYMSEYFVIWHPKDVVGGDIYLLEELRHDDEMLLFVIDCTGHGVPGAFVTMLVKAIERQIVGHILNSDHDEPVSPAQLLGVFNRSMKNLLKQESKESISNAGFDGGILYYNRVENRLIYAGAKTPLFVMKNGVVEVIQGDRHSVGYKRSRGNYSFTDHVVELDVDTTVYLSTDGYMDQQGEESALPFGKKKMIALMNEYAEESLSDQQEVFLDELMEHQGDRVANDDVTMVALKFLTNKKGN